MKLTLVRNELAPTEIAQLLISDVLEVGLGLLNLPEIGIFTDFRFAFPS